VRKLLNKIPKDMQLLAIVIVVLSLLFVFSYVFSTDKAGKKLERVSLASAELSVSSVTSVEVKGPHALYLKKTEKGWFVVSGSVEVPAMDTRVDFLLKAIGKVAEMLPVGNDQKSWAEFELDAAKADRVTVRGQDGKVVSDFWAGKYNYSGRQVFVRPEGQDRVFSADSEMGSYIKSELSSWEDKRLFGPFFESETTKDSVKSVLSELRVKANIPAAEGVAALSLDYSVKVADKQVVSGGAAKAISDEALKDLYQRMTGLTGDYWLLDDKIATGLDAPVARIELAFDSRTGYKPLAILVGGKAPEGGLYVRLENFPDRTGTLIVPEAVIRAALGSPESLEASAAPSAGPEGGAVASGAPAAK
jgi:hypothetical protein